MAGLMDDYGFQLPNTKSELKGGEKLLKAAEK